MIGQNSNIVEPTQNSLDNLAIDLAPQHLEHLLHEGFTRAQIAEWVESGLQTLTEQQAYERGFRVKTKDGYKSNSGLYIPFTQNFGQIRLDTPLERENGQLVKYLTPVGAKSQPLIPQKCKVITEGAKDAQAGTVHGGIPTGALAGVSHYRKALKPDTGYTVLFDADGWTNPNVFSNLFHAGKWLNGKVQLLPQIVGQPKAGLCEYFQAGYTPQDYAALIASAMKPEALLLEWGNHFKDIPAHQVDRAVHVAFRLAAEYLCPLQQEQVFNAIKAATKLSSKGLGAQLEKERAVVLSKRRKLLEKNLRKTPLSASLPQNPRHVNLDQRATVLLESGILLELISALLKKTGAVGIDEHIQLALASTLGTLRQDRKRNIPTLFTGSSGIGKSMVLDILGDLLPHNKGKRVSGVSDAVLKRIGDKWQGQTLLIDEFSTWASSEIVLSILKELITRGETSFEILEQGQKGEWEVKHFDVAGPIGIAACATEATLSTIFGNAEEEIRSRFNELPLPEDADYITRISKAAFSGLEPLSLREKFPHIIALIHRAIELSVERKIPTIDPLFEAALWQHIKPDRPLFPRLMKRLKILLENMAALLGKSAIDLETYSVIFPLVSKVFRRSLTSANDATLDNFVRFASNLRDLGGGYLPFKIAKVQEMLSASQATAYRWRDKWESLGWITQGEGRGFWNLTGKGAAQVELVTLGKDPGLPDILPPVAKVAATIQRLSQSSHPNSHEIITPINIPQRPLYQGLRDFLLSLNSHQILTKFSPSESPQILTNQGEVPDNSHLNSQILTEKERLAPENISLTPVTEPERPNLDINDTTEKIENEKKNSTLSPENSENLRINDAQNTSKQDTVGDIALYSRENLVRTSEKSVRTSENSSAVPAVEPDYSTYPNPKSDNIRSSEKRALALKEALLAPGTKEDLSKLRRMNGGEYSGREIKWVIVRMTSTEKQRLDEKIATSQRSLLD